MYTFITILFFAGFYLFYNTSKKVKTGREKAAWQLWLASKPVVSKLCGAVLFLTGWLLLIDVGGGGGGSFAVLAYFMCAGSIIVLLAPLGFLTPRTLFALCFISILLEYLIR